MIGHLGTVRRLVRGGAALGLALLLVLASGWAIGGSWSPEGLTLCALELGSFPQLVEQMCRDRKYEFQLLPPGIDNMLAHVDKVLLLHGTNGKWHSMIDMILASGVPLSTYDLTPAPMAAASLPKEPQRKLPNSRALRPNTYARH